MADMAMEIVHAGTPGPPALCKIDKYHALPAGHRLVPLEQVEDPEHPEVLTCGDCLQELNGGAEPSMGGGNP